MMKEARESEAAASPSITLIPVSTCAATIGVGGGWKQGNVSVKAQDSTRLRRDQQRGSGDFGAHCERKGRGKSISHPDAVLEEERKGAGPDHAGREQARENRPERDPPR
eukprot:2968806-Rhodomonas_salina.1